MIIFVTGFHRGGSRSLSEYMADQNGLPWVQEINISLKDITKIPDIISQQPGDFVLHCPFLSAEVDELLKYGDVVFADRATEQIVRSMRDNQMTRVAWEMMNKYREVYPSDPVWEKVVYENRIDSISDGRCKYVGYYTLLVNLIRYFRDKHFGTLPVYVLEEMPYYAGLSSKVTPLTATQITKKQEFETRCVGYFS